MKRIFVTVAVTWVFSFWCRNGHGRRKDFFQERANSIFFQGLLKRFFQSGPKVVKLHFTHSKLRKQTFVGKNLVGK